MGSNPTGGIMELTETQYELLRLWVLGGIEAVPRHSTRTINALIAKGFVDKSGPTIAARTYVGQCELDSLQAEK